MITLGQRVENLGAVSKEMEPVTAATIDTYTDDVSQVGAALGMLYATCCTHTREKLYISMFKTLGGVHTQLSRMKGLEH